MLPVKRTIGTEYLVCESTGIAYMKDGTPVSIESVPHLKYALTVGYASCLFAWQRGEWEPCNLYFSPYAEDAVLIYTNEHGRVMISDGEQYGLCEIITPDEAAREYVARAIAAMEARLSEFRSTAREFGLL